MYVSPTGLYQCILCQFQNCVQLCSNFGYFNNQEQFTQTIQKYIAVVKEIAISAE
jgi:hypothetical protein